jgi:hypothetical protein
MRTGSYAPTPSPQVTTPRKRNLSASAIPVRPPPALRNSAPTTPQPVKEEDEEEEEEDKDDYGDLGINAGEHREEEEKEERERLR